MTEVGRQRSSWRSQSEASDIKKRRGSTTNLTYFNRIDTKLLLDSLFLCREPCLGLVLAAGNAGPTHRNPCCLILLCLVGLQKAQWQ